MQRALEGGGLMLTEDGGRIVKPHRMFRIFATGNTVGQGDEFGMYQGARPQSLAMLDRFTVWVKVEYLNSTERKKLHQGPCGRAQ
jgi:cobaltochelatase CobS